MSQAAPAPRALILRWSERCFLAVGLLCLGWFAVSLVESKLYEIYGNARLGRVVSVPRGITDGPPRDLRAEGARKEARASGVIGRIEIPRGRVSALISEGSEESTLRRAVGHLPRSPFPGERGNVALAGHRETHFRGLQHVRPRDRIVITTPDGVFKYSVEWTRVVGPNATEVLAADDGSTLTLITCHPFDYIGRAPDRFVVRARQLDPTR